MLTMIDVLADVAVSNCEDKTKEQVKLWSVIVEEYEEIKTRLQNLEDANVMARNVIEDQDRQITELRGRVTELERDSEKLDQRCQLYELKVSLLEAFVNLAEFMGLNETASYLHSVMGIEE